MASEDKDTSTISIGLQLELSGTPLAGASVLEEIEEIIRRTPGAKITLNNQKQASNRQKNTTVPMIGLVRKRHLIYGAPTRKGYEAYTQQGKAVTAIPQEGTISATTSVLVDKPLESSHVEQFTPNEDLCSTRIAHADLLDAQPADPEGAHPSAINQNETPLSQRLTAEEGSRHSYRSHEDTVRHPVDPAKDATNVESVSDFSDSSSGEETVLNQWFVTQPNNDTIVLEGHRIGDPEGEFWHSSNITKRLSATLLVTTSGSKYRLRGLMDREMALEQGFSVALVKKFQQGFPKNWKELLKEHCDAKKKKETAEKKPKQRRVRKMLHDAPNNDKSVTPQSNQSEDGFVTPTNETTLPKSVLSIKKCTPKVQATPKRNLKTPPYVSITDLQLTRSGRRKVPPLAFWTNQRMRENIRENKVEILGGVVDYTPSSVHHVRLLGEDIGGKKITRGKEHSLKWNSSGGVKSYSKASVKNRKKECKKLESAEMQNASGVSDSVTEEEKKAKAKPHRQTKKQIAISVPENGSDRVLRSRGKTQKHLAENTSEQKILRSFSSDMLQRTSRCTTQGIETDSVSESENDSKYDLRNGIKKRNQTSRGIHISQSSTEKDVSSKAKGRSTVGLEVQKKDLNVDDEERNVDRQEAKQSTERVRGVEDKATCEKKSDRKRGRRYNQNDKIEIKHSRINTNPMKNTKQCLKDRENSSGRKGEDTKQAKKVDRKKGGRKNSSLTKQTNTSNRARRQETPVPEEEESCSTDVNEDDTCPVKSSNKLTKKKQDFDLYSSVLDVVEKHKTTRICSRNKSRKFCQKVASVTESQRPGSISKQRSKQDSKSRKRPAVYDLSDDDDDSKESDANIDGDEEAEDDKMEDEIERACIKRRVPSGRTLSSTQSHRSRSRSRERSKINKEPSRRGSFEVPIIYTSDKEDEISFIEEAIDSGISKKGKARKDRTIATNAKKSSGTPTQSQSERLAAQDERLPAEQHQWTKPELDALYKAVRSINPDSRNYWDNIASLVPTKTAIECQQRFHSVCDKDISKTKKKKVVVAKKNAPESLAITAKPGTLKRKKQLRALADFHAACDEEDLFERPTKKPNLGLAFLNEESEDEDDDTGINVNTKTPSSKIPHLVPFSSKRTPSNYFSPGLLHSVDRNKLDDYVHKLQKRKFVKLSKFTTPLKPAEVSSNIGGYKSLFQKRVVDEEANADILRAVSIPEEEEESETEQDYYWSDESDQ